MNRRCRRRVAVVLLAAVAGLPGMRPGEAHAREAVLAPLHQAVAQLDRCLARLETSAARAQRPLRRVCPELRASLRDPAILALASSEVVAVSDAPAPSDAGRLLALRDALAQLLTLVGQRAAAHAPLAAPELRARALPYSGLGRGASSWERVTALLFERDLRSGPASPRRASGVVAPSSEQGPPWSVRVARFSAWIAVGVASTLLLWLLGVLLSRGSGPWRRFLPRRPGDAGPRVDAASAAAAAIRAEPAVLDAGDRRPAELLARHAERLGLTRAAAADRIDHLTARELGEALAQRAGDAPRPAELAAVLGALVDVAERLRFAANRPAAAEVDAIVARADEGLRRLEAAGAA